ncbi:MAG TPA: hypothetical protein VHT26_05765, partial [Trebonia sp.]|nr:hypothetical protein [Trebonia sp.]
ARATALAMLGSLQRALGDLDRITAWLRVFGMVNVAPGFNQTPAVITFTVLLSVVLHGVTAEPLAAWYSRLLARRTADQAAAQMPEMPEMPDRRLIRRNSLPHGDPPGAEPR